jgi:hypothetical protein
LRAFGFGAGLRPAGGGEVGLGLTARLAGLPVGMVEVGKALDPDLVRVPRGGRLCPSASAASAVRADKTVLLFQTTRGAGHRIGRPTANPSQRQRSPSRLTRR